MRHARRRRGLTLRALARRAGLDFTYLSKVERGRLPATRATERVYRSLLIALALLAALAVAPAGAWYPPDTIEFRRTHAIMHAYGIREVWISDRNGLRFWRVGKMLFVEAIVQDRREVGPWWAERIAP